MPFGVRYVVGRHDEMPAAVTEILDAQADLDLVPATDLVVYRNARAVPPAAAVVADDEVEAIVSSDDLTMLQTWRDPPISLLRPLGTSAGWTGPARGANLAIASAEFDDAWRLEGSDAPPERAFGWSTSFPVSSEQVTVTYGAQLPRTVAMVVLAVLWLVALWITRKPVRG